MHDNYNGRYYAKAQNLVRVLQEAYDAAFAEYDILAMPTTPMKAAKLPAPNANGFEIAANALPMIYVSTKWVASQIKSRHNAGCSRCWASAPMTCVSYAKREGFIWLRTVALILRQ